MAREKRRDVFRPDEIAIAHCMNRVARKDFLLGFDEETGTDYSYRKGWFEDELKRLAACFGIDLLTYSIMDNHFHLILRSRPDIVALWDDREVARRWLELCPKRKEKNGSIRQPTEAEINLAVADKAGLKKFRSRLSDISWWMRLISQRIAQRANRESGDKGCFWQGRFKAVRLLDEASLLACSAYVDLNPIRAAMAQRLEDCQFTAAQRRLNAFPADLAGEAGDPSESPDSFLPPMEIDELRDPIGPHPSSHPGRCSDKGYLPMSRAAYFDLLDWTARQIVQGKVGYTPEDTPAIFQRLGFTPEIWYQLVTSFRKMFGVYAGMPESIDAHRARCGTKGNMPRATRQLLSGKAPETVST